MSFNRQDHHIEVIDLLNPKYRTDLLKAPLAGSFGMIGGVLKCCGQNWPFYSDGYYGVILGEQQYKTFEILDGHSQQSGVILNQEKLYINGRGKSSTLISLDHAAIKGPDLPFSIQGSDVVGEQKSGLGRVQGLLFGFWSGSGINISGMSLSGFWGILR